MRVGVVVFVVVLGLGAGHAAPAGSAAPSFPRPLDEYRDSPGVPLLRVMRERASAEPFNVVATTIFFLAILHTFLAPKLTRLSHKIEQRHKHALTEQNESKTHDRVRGEVSFLAEALHFLGEIEAIFGIWVVPLMIALTFSKGWPTARDYIGHGRDFTEPLFVVVIMTIAASRPILKISEQMLAIVARLGRNSTSAWWFSILTVGPLLGSLITEPAAMTISALLLARKFYPRKPSSRLAYATLGLLFVNVSVGGTLTHFAAPPVLMVASRWGWGPSYMVTHFGWKAVVGILLANVLYACFFRNEFRRIGGTEDIVTQSVTEKNVPMPFWVTLTHLLFLSWTVVTSHFPALFIGGFLYYLAFLQATEHHQNELSLRPALLVGFFLAGLVVHGGLQGWWIQPLLSGLKQSSLFVTAGILTAFNDNAAITYLASLVPDLSDSLRYAVVAGAVTGGGLTVIANAPNPAGQAILGRFFPEGISPLYLLAAALVPTVLLGALFLIL